MGNFGDEAIDALRDLHAEVVRLRRECESTRAERDRLRTAVETVALLDDLDCGDSGCGFARQKSGMRTNGGCRCIEARQPGVRSRVGHVVRTLRAVLDVDHA